MGLLDLVEEDDTVRPAPHRLGEDSALAVTHVAGRRAFEARNSVRLLVLGHVDDDHVAVASVQEVGEGMGSLRLADAAWPDQKEHRLGAPWVLQLGSGRLDTLADSFQGVGLADDPALHELAERQHCPDLILDHLAHGDTCPAGDDLRHRLCVHADLHERRFALRLRQLLVEAGKLSLELGHVIVRQPSLGRRGGRTSCGCRCMLLELDPDGP